MQASRAKKSPGRMESVQHRPALLLACGNSLRQDDGVGLRIAEAAEQLFPASRLRIVAAQQFTPEMAAELATTELVIFVDASAADEPGAIRVIPVAARKESPDTHRLEPAALLAMAQSLCGHAPARAFALTIGAGCFGYGEEISGPLRQAVPRALRLVTNLVTAYSAKA
ncbi:MAG: hydrogenase maturation protease [Acidobacteriaceae bacterium]